jgi:hypothetical protein
MTATLGFQVFSSCRMQTCTKFLLFYGPKASDIVTEGARDRKTTRHESVLASLKLTPEWVKI